MKSKLRIQLVNIVKRYNGKKSESALRLLGCEAPDFMRYIENQWIGDNAWMNWANYGEWHFDHRRPCASFDLLLEEDQRRCFHFTNLQPMEGGENCSKKDSYDPDTFPYFWDPEAGYLGRVGSR